jgi:hypothetical protein
MERLRIELHRKPLNIVPRDLNFLALETHSQTKIVKPLDQRSLPLSQERNLQSRKSIRLGLARNPSNPATELPPTETAARRRSLFDRHDSVGCLDQIVVAVRGAIFGERLEVLHRLILIQDRRRILFGIEAFYGRR